MTTRRALRFLWAPLLAGALVPAALGCDARPAGTRDSGTPDTDGSVRPPGCTPGTATFICEGVSAIECRADGTQGSRTDCSLTGEVCVNGQGCRTCRPNSFQCNGNDVERCNAAGTGYEPFATCDGAAGQMCNALIGACTSLCDDAAASNSYIGCEYFPVATTNSQVYNDFLPAVVVANPQTMPANVSVTGPGGFSASRSIAAGGIETIELQWVDALKNTSGSEVSALVPGGAYRLVSNVPVTVYQFNPLEYRIPRDCRDASGTCDGSSTDPLFGLPICDNQCFSHTNDASLLLPAHAMTGNYMVLSRPAMLTRIVQGASSQLISGPGFFAVVGADDAPVSVDITFRGRTVAGSTGSSLRAYAPGESGTFTLNRGDVLQFIGAAPTTCTPGSTDTFTGGRVEYCTVSSEYDLTGTEIRATGRVQVIGGHNCAFVPYNRWACDHLETALFPLETWGTESIVSRTRPPMGRSDPNVIRIISGRDGNVLNFDPLPPGVSAGMTLNRGQIIEFETTQSFRVQGTEALMVAQFLVGQDYGGLGASGEMGEGDPAMSLGIPTEQFRTSYTFLAPSSYPTGFVNVTAPNGATVTLDGTQVSGFTPVGGTGFSVAQVSVSSGSHSISSDQPFGIVVYGYGSYTSYMYPGGLDLNAINIPF